MEGLEKAFSACEIPEGEKLALVKYLMTNVAYNWWKGENTRNVTWARFREMFFDKYFSNATRDRMLGQLLSLKQGNRSMGKYEAEFNRLMRYALVGIKDDERTKTQKFKDGLDPKLLHDIPGHGLTTLGALVNKAKLMEDSRNKLKNKKAKDKMKAMKRPFSAIRSRGFQKGSSSSRKKKPALGKQKTSTPSKQTWTHPKGTCKNCLEPYLDSECKWTPRVCFSCGKVGH